MSQNLEITFRKAKKLQAEGRVIEAATLYSEILGQFPNNTRAKSALIDIQQQAKSALLGSQLGQLQSLVAAGRNADARSFARGLPTVAQGSSDVQALLGQACFKMGQVSDAEGYFLTAARLNPSQASHWVAAGNAAFNANAFQRAEEYFQKARKLIPSSPDVLNNLGMALAAQGRFNDAETVFSEATQQNPNNSKLAYNRANALRDAGQHLDAITEYNRALNIDPNYASAANNLGTVLHQLGRESEAEAAYQKAVTALPDYAQAHRNLSAVHRYTADDPLIGVLDRQLALAQTPREKMYLCFARSKAHEDQAEYALAFDRLVEANAIRKRLISYDIHVDELLFETLTKLFSVPLPPLSVSKSHPRPVFVLGMMRSGTTLVEQILSSHSDVFGAGELETLGQLCLPMMERFHAQGQRPEPADLAHMRASYLGQVSRMTGMSPVVTDKMPVNFRWIGFIMAAFPEARIIHLQRDSVATCWSIFKHYFSSDGNGYAFDLQDVAAYWHLYTDLMAHWRRLYPGQILDVPYESLTEDAEAWSRKIVEFAGLPWQDACLDFHLNARAVRTASASQVKRKIYKGSSEAWRKFEGNLAPLLSALNR